MVLRGNDLKDEEIVGMDRGGVPEVVTTREMDLVTRETDFVRRDGER